MKLSKEHFNIRLLLVTLLQCPIIGIVPLKSREDLHSWILKILVQMGLSIFNIILDRQIDRLTWNIFERNIILYVTQDKKKVNLEWLPQEECYLHKNY